MAYLSIELLFWDLVLQQFTQLLEQQATIDQYAEWASNLVDTCLKVNLISSDVCGLYRWFCALSQHMIFNVLHFSVLLEIF